MNDQAKEESEGNEMEWVFCSFNSSYSSWFSFSISKKWILKERTHDFQEMEMNERVSFLCYF